MNYHVAFWIHNRIDDPIIIMYEVDEMKNVIRMFEWYKDGRANRLIANSSSSPSLIDIPFDPSDRDWKSTEIHSFETTRQDFEEFWKSHS